MINEVGANLAAIQDDIQAGYMNMEDYINWVRVEQMHNNRKDVSLNYENTKKRLDGEQDFKDIWDEGVKMQWKMTPVEQQKTQVNWRQNINSEDRSPKKLDLYQPGNGLGSTGLNPKSTITQGNDSKDAKDKQKDLNSTANGDKNNLDPAETSQSGGSSGSGENTPEAAQEKEAAINELKEITNQYNESFSRSQEYLNIIDQYHNKWESTMDKDPNYHGGMTIPQYGKAKFPQDAKDYDEACNMVAQCGQEQEQLLNKMEEIRKKHNISVTEVPLNLNG